MGVGYPEDLLVSVALGADMFDCVWPTRTAVRFPYSCPTSEHFSRHTEQLSSTTALRQRHCLNRHPESPSCLFRQRLRHRRSGLHVPMLSARGGRRSRRHACLHPSCCCEGDGRCSSVRASYLTSMAIFLPPRTARG